MLVAYLICLLVGGVFVGMSVASGLSGGDADVGGHDGGDGDFGGDHDLGGDHDFAGDHDLGSVDGLDVDHDGVIDVHHETALGEAALAGTDGRDERPSASRRGTPPILRLLTSFRFWTFGSAFFGLTGTLLTALHLTAEPATLLTALAMGLGVGGVTAALVQSLRKPVTGDIIARGDHVGQVGELLFTLRPGGVSKVAFSIRHKDLVLLCVMRGEAELPAGTRVVVLDIDDDGRAVVAPEAALFARGGDREGLGLALEAPDPVEEGLADEEDA